MTELRTTPEQRAALRRQLERTGRGLHLWRYEAKALLDDADALAGALAELTRERRRTAALQALIDRCRETLVDAMIYSDPEPSRLAGFRVWEMLETEAPGRPGGEGEGR